MTQLPLPTFDLRPLCAICRQPADLLGQYSPLYPHMVCRACAEHDPYPIEALELDPENKDRSGLRVRRNAPSSLRESRMWLDQWIVDCARPRWDDRPFYKFNLTALQLRNGVRRGANRQPISEWRMRQRALHIEATQNVLPICWRCGHAHTRQHTDGSYTERCQHCADMDAVEALYRNRGIFAGDDPETVLDRLYVAFPDLFQRGILPDAWFALMRPGV